MLATLAQRYRLHLVPGHKVDPWPLITLRPRFGMQMIIEKAVGASLAERALEEQFHQHLVVFNAVDPGRVFRNGGADFQG